MADDSTTGTMEEHLQDIASSTTPRSNNDAAIMEVVDKNNYDLQDIAAPVRSYKKKGKTMKIAAEIVCQSILADVKNTIDTASPAKLKDLMVAHPNSKATGCYKIGTKFQARISWYAIIRNIGSFSTEEEAALAYALTNEAKNKIEQQQQWTKKKHTPQFNLDGTVGIRKLFDGDYYNGTIESFDEDEGWYSVKYEDGDVEDITEFECTLLVKDYNKNAIRWYRKNKNIGSFSIAEEATYHRAMTKTIEDIIEDRKKRKTNDDDHTGNLNENSDSPNEESNQPSTVSPVAVTKKKKSVHGIDDGSGSNVIDDDNNDNNRSHLEPRGGGRGGRSGRGGRGRRTGPPVPVERTTRSSRRNAVDRSSTIAFDNWIQCEIQECQKWRKVPANRDISHYSNERFVCSKINSWTATSTIACNTPEEYYEYDNTN